MSDLSYSLDRPKGKLLGFVEVIETPRCAVKASASEDGAQENCVPAQAVHLPPAINYESLIAEAKNSGFSVACVGHVEGGVDPILMVALKRSENWEVFAGAHHRLERIAVDSKTSFDFGGGMFLTGRDQSGEMVSILIPDYNQDNLGLIPTYNGAKIRAF